jgi:hypothetical protein
MSEFDLTEDLEPEESPDQEEFDGTGPGADSDDTGTHYEDGAAETTVHDLEVDAGREE